MNALVKSLTKYLTEIVTATKVICKNCGWSWDLDDGGEDKYICHNILPNGTKCRCNNTPGVINELGDGTAEPFELTKKITEKDIESYILDQIKLLTPEDEDEDEKKDKPGVRNQLKYLFSSDTTKTNYEANISTLLIPPPKEVTDKKPNLYIGVGFDVVGGKGESTNLNELYRIMATVLEIVVDFVNTVDEMNDVVLKQIQLFPISDQSVEVSSINSRRGRLYEEYIKNNLNKFDKKYRFSSSPDGRSFVIRPVHIFPIKENQTKAWDLKEGIVRLSKYMLDKGLKVKPLPNVKFIKDDEENASNMLGKTAYYNPSEKSITLYTFGRHPKDVLRSFSHEMIHHMQNLEGRLNNITTTNTNEDGDLPELEREAYELGNVTLRKWEDSLKN